MADQHLNPSAALNEQGHQLRQLAQRLNSDLLKLGALVTAFRLAASADEGGGEHALYWPDLMDMIEEKMPSSAAYDALLSPIVASLGEIAASVADAHVQVRPAAALGANVAPRAARSRKALADHVAA